jgi:hypothetical protein
VLGTRTPVQRCQIHKQRNVLDHLAERDREPVKRRLRRAWAESDYDRSLKQLTALAAELQRSHPGAAASLREGMAETLTVTRLGVKGKLRKTLASTNPCESMIECVRRTARNVKHWQNGDMCLRWTAAGMLEAEQQFRRIIGYQDLANLSPASSAKSPFPSPTRHRPWRPLSSPPRSHITPGPPPKFHTVRDILVQPRARVTIIDELLDHLMSVRHGRRAERLKLRGDGPALLLALGRHPRIERHSHSPTAFAVRLPMSRPSRNPYVSRSCASRGSSLPDHAGRRGPITDPRNTGSAEGQLISPASPRCANRRAARISPSCPSASTIARSCS